MSALTILLLVIVVIVLWVIVAYNGLIASRNRTEEAASDIDVQTKRRYDLVPNLVESVKGYIKQEKGVLEDVTKARAAAIAADGSLDSKAKAENVLTGALKSVFAVAENYPDLKSSANFQQLSGELSDIEDKIQAARRFYNANARDYNTKIQVFPTNIFARSLGFTKKDLFTSDDEPASRDAVKVSF